MRIKKSLLSILFFLFTCILYAQDQGEITINEDIKLIHVQDSIFIHLSYHSLEEYGRFSSNGLFIIKNGKAIMIDTPLDNEKTEILINYLKEEMNIEVTQVIIGHHHDDCMGGLEYLQSIGVESLAHEITMKKCKELGRPLAKASFQKPFLIDFYGEEILCQYFGAGHSIDNITVYLPQQDLLFGGCLIKAMKSNKLGNTKDAYIEDWANSVENIIKAYPDIEKVIPGHGDIGGPELLVHTIQLVNQH